MSLPDPSSAVRPHEYDKFHALFERAYLRPWSRAQISNWKFKREMAWKGWLWARATPYVEPKNTLTSMFVQPITPEMIAGTALKIRPLTVRYASAPPSADLCWLETAHFMPEDGQIVLLAWPRTDGFTFRTGRFSSGKWRLSCDTEPRQKPVFFASLKS